MHLKVFTFNDFATAYTTQRDVTAQKIQTLFGMAPQTVDAMMQAAFQNINTDGAVYFVAYVKPAKPGHCPPCRIVKHEEKVLVTPDELNKLNHFSIDPFTKTFHYIRGHDPDAMYIPPEPEPAVPDLPDPVALRARLKELADKMAALKIEQAETLNEIAAVKEILYRDFGFIVINT